MIMMCRAVSIISKSMVDGILAAGWKFNFVRMHLDPYWSDDPTMQSVRYEGHERFSETRFRKYLDELFVPMAEYFNVQGHVRSDASARVL